MELLWENSGRRPGPVDDVTLEDVYAFPQVTDRPWVRANFVSTLDGRATGADGLSGSINNDADKAVFRLQRRFADAVLVGAGTAQAEGYRPLSGGSTAPTLVVVSNHARVPEGLRTSGENRGRALLVTCSGASDDALATARRALGEDNVWVIGSAQVDLAGLVSRLAEDGMRRILCEGGPTLFGDLLQDGLVDELALTTVPVLVGGDGPRVTGPSAYERTMELQHLLTEGSTLLQLWRRTAPAAGEDT